MVSYVYFNVEDKEISVRLKVYEDADWKNYWSKKYKKVEFSLTMIKNKKKLVARHKRTGFNVYSLVLKNDATTVNKRKENYEYQVIECWWDQFGVL